MIVAYGTASLCDVLHTTLVGTLDVVAEGEEGVAAQSHSRVLGNPFAFLLACKHFGLLLEEQLPCALSQHVVVVVADIHVDGVVAVSTTDSVDERQ